MDQRAAVTLLFTFPHMPTVVLAMSDKAASIAITISETINPYSTAVAPRVERNSLRKKLDIGSHHACCRTPIQYPSYLQEG